MTGCFRRRSRRLRYKADGRLFDLDERRFVELAELADDIRAGRPFRAQRQGTGAECTNEVLVEVLRSTVSHQAGQAVAPTLFDMASWFLRPPDEEEPRPPENGDRRMRRRP
ncbi:hypothetical protein ACFHW2_24995 [Actinomadura sp. LOL_016]|uniref:hypothetical protein n=1 Tax=unclassified Actinomadura TaxID=2626254 RepID=UPI003A806458